MDKLSCNMYEVRRNDEAELRKFEARIEHPGLTDEQRVALELVIKMSRMTMHRYTSLPAKELAALPREFQIQRYLDIYAHKELEMTEEQYSDSFPELGDLKVSLQFDDLSPLFVDPRISAEKWCELFGVYTKKLQPETVVPRPNVSPSESPYVTLFHPGLNNFGHSVMDTVSRGLHQMFSARMRAATFEEILAFTIVGHPADRSGDLLVAGGSQSSKDHPFLAPTLDRDWKSGRITLSDIHLGEKTPGIAFTSVDHRTK